MQLGSYTKTAAERRRYSIDYSDWLQPSESVVSVVFTVTTQIPPDTVVNPLVVDAFTVSSPEVVFFVSLGDDNASYIVDVQATTSIGQVREDILVYTVQEPTASASC